MITQQQLDLGLDKACGFGLKFPTARRLSRAQWWFAQMRHVVDQALAWQPTPSARPEQIWLVEPQRQNHL